MPWIGTVSYGVAALLYGATAVLFLVSHPGGRQASMLAAAVLTTSIWAGVTVFLLTRQISAPAGYVALDALHMLVWALCVLSWLESPSAKRVLIAALVCAGVWGVAVTSVGRLWTDMGWTVGLSLVVMSLIGFLAVEQVFRNADEEQHRHLKLFCLATGGLFVANLFVYAQTSLFTSFPNPLWEARGLFMIFLLPLIILAAKRQKKWERELFVSRHVVFYSASILGTGVYLLAMGLVAYVIRALGGEWSFVLELIFLIAAAAMLVVVLFSATIRSRFRVQLIKHFYRNKYDYREEWLSLTQTLDCTGDLTVVTKNALRGIARIINAQQADLWLDRDGKRYEWMASLDDDKRCVQDYDLSAPLVRFLRSTGWVIDSDEYAEHPDRYHNAFGQPGEEILPARSVIVPLERQKHVQGFVIMRKPDVLRRLNFEDHDMLKTAGRQVAVVLAQTQAQEQLAEALQFEAMSKLSAFLMHDLKNVVAQQELVVANAQRFRHRPEFIDDAIATVRLSVERMKKILEQLKATPRAPRAVERVDVSKVLMEVRSQCADRAPIPRIDSLNGPLWVNMERDKLSSLLTHLVRNSQDATPPDGSISMSVANGGDELHITVADTGCGMDEDFVRYRLFKPFDTTKGVKGMGMGAYQVRHLVREAGGEVEVSSRKGEGTIFRLKLPVVEQ